MDNPDDSPPQQPDRTATVDAPKGDKHIATRSVVLYRAPTKKIKVLSLMGRHVRTKVWKKPKGPKRPPSIGSMQPPGRKR